VLIVDDSEDDAVLIVRALKRGGYRPDCTRVSSPERFADALAEPWDVILCDSSVPRLELSRLLWLVHGKRGAPPLLVVSGRHPSQLGEAVTDPSVRGLVSKNRLDDLPGVVRWLVGDTVTSCHP